MFRSLAVFAPMGIIKNYKAVIDPEALTVVHDKLSQ